MVKTNHVFHDKTITISEGQELILDNLESETTVLLSVSGTSTSRTVIFEGKGLNGGYKPINGFNENSATLETQTTSVATELFSFDLTGFSAFNCNVVAIEGGNVTIQGKVIV